MLYSVTQVVWHKVLLTQIWGVPPAGGPLLQLPTAQSGWWNNPNLSPQNLVPDHLGHPVVTRQKLSQGYITFFRKLIWNWEQGNQSDNQCIMVTHVTLVFSCACHGSRSGSKVFLIRNNLKNRFLLTQLLYYRVIHLPQDLGWVDLDFGCSIVCPILPMKDELCLTR